jgi:hypothetical protein
VVWLCDEHLPTDREFEKRTVHCLQGSWGAEIVRDLEPDPQDLRIPKTRYSGFFQTDLDERLRRLGAGLKPGSSAIVAVIEHTWVSELEADLQRAGAEIVVESIAADVAAQLDAGNEVAYTAIADSQGGVAARVVASPEGDAKQVTAPEGEAKPVTPPEGEAKPSS